MGVDNCWFCTGPVRGNGYLLLGMSRNVEYTPLLIAVYTRGETAWVRVPRCGRCEFGHGAEKVTCWISVASALVTGLCTVLMAGSYVGGSPWADSWQIVIPWIWTLGWLVLWRGVRQRRINWRWLAPRPERYAREHPAVVELAADGWE